jgi:serine/threonine protein kinase
MSTVIEEVTEKSASTTLTAAGSARWLAPELIEGSIASPTLTADTYSFAMAILELLTCKHPFADLKRDASVIHNIVVLKKMPIRPDAQRWLSDDLWELMRECWSTDAQARPRMSVVAERMKHIDKDLPQPEADAMDTS